MTIVLFPDPEGPTRAVTFPRWKQTLKDFKTDTSGRVGYAKVTSLKTISDRLDTLVPSTGLRSESIIEKKDPDALTALVITINGAKMLPSTVVTIRTEKKTPCNNNTNIRNISLAIKLQPKPERQREASIHGEKHQA